MSSLLVKLVKSNDRFWFMEAIGILLKILNNIIKAPDNPKYRKLELDDIIYMTIIKADGAPECLTYIGFELCSSENALVLPQTVPISKLQIFRSELYEFRKAYMAEMPIDLPTAERSTARFLFFHEIRMHSKQVLQYEKDELQATTRSRIPLEELHRRLEKNKRSDTNDFEKEFALLYELMMWFKEEFFHWVDSPRCENCNGHSATFQGYSNNPRNFVLSDRIEVFKCNNCSAQLLFPRYNDPAMLLETRSGRCGEWANCFTLMCRALGFDARFVVDRTDHVWTEVYSNSQKRWIHCDVCEGQIDAPLMYEIGWMKNLNYVMAFSKDEVQDVTWRYTTRFNDVLSRRKICPEEALLKLIFDLSEQLQTSLPKERKRYLLERRAMECVEFLTPPNTDKQYGGRISGSLAWRLSRREFALSENHTWSPNETELERKRFRIRYSTAKDQYHRVETNEIIAGWANGVYECESVFRKVEKDWEMCYLCRQENTSSGLVKWNFSVKGMGAVIDKVLIIYHCATFETGSVKIMVCSADICSTLDPKKNVFETDAFRGLNDLYVTVIMSGGSGQEAWQKAQLFRQSIRDDAFLFELDVTLYEDPNNQPTTEKQGKT